MSRRSFTSSRGSLLLTTFIVIVVVAIMVGSALRSSSFEYRANHRHELYNKAIYTVESTLEYGASQIGQRFMRFTSLDPGILITNPLSKPPTDRFSAVPLQGLTLRGGLTPSPERTFIDPAIPANALDPLNGQFVHIRNVLMIGSATMTHSTFGDVTAYGKYRVQVRDANIFSNAIFYDGDLTLGSGPDTDIRGPVYAGGSLGVGVGTGSTLRMFGGAKTAGNFFHANRPGDPHNEFRGNIRIRSGGSNDHPQFANMNNGGNGFDNFLYNRPDLPADVPEDNWKNAALNRWNGWVKDEAHDIEYFEPPALSQFSSGLRALIEPSVPASDPGFDENVERIKMANKSDLVIVVDFQKHNPTYDPTIDPDTGARYEFPNSPREDATAGPDALRIHTDPFDLGYLYAKNRRYDIHPTDADQQYQDNLVQDDNTVTVTAYNYVPASNGDYAREGGRFNRVPVSIPNLHTNDEHTIIRSRNVDVSDPTDPGTPIKMWDGRRRKFVHLAEVDLGNLKTAVDSGAVGNWNGAVYVETRIGGQTLEATDASGNPIFDKRVPIDAPLTTETEQSASRTGIRIVNGKVGNVPTDPNPGDDQGFTLTTNNMVYIKGSLNADGDVSGDTTAPDAGEVPVAIIADAISIISEKWKDEESRRDPNQTHHGNRDWHNDRSWTANDTEIAAALIAGNQNPADNANAKDDGSVNNLLSFRELWGPKWNKNKTLRIRGSIVNLFHSKVGWEPFQLAYVYQPPIRDWGYSDLFLAGNLPPQSPTVRTFRRIEYRDISPQEYAELDALFDQVATGGMDEDAYRTKLEEIRVKYEGGTPST